jgi:7-carboxy-7-deazaguanine synthase
VLTSLTTDPRLFLSEIFYSIQGEGELTGVPSVFIRTSGCNLRCRWCDTKYASWEPEGYQRSFAEILAEVARHPASHVVLTGGEPMVAKELPALAAALRGISRHITIETAGTVAPNGIACDLASLSPKLRHSTPEPGEISAEWIARHESARLQPAILREWIERYPYQLKFVVARAEDLREIEELVAAIGVPIPPHKVLLMPEGIDHRTLESRREMLVAACKKKGYRYCERLHVALFGHRRGT